VQGLARSGLFSGRIDRLKTRLNALRARVPLLADVRGPGRMVGAEFIDPATDEPSSAFAKQVQTLALERGLILLTCDVYGNVIRFLYPLRTRFSTKR
jgi:4-aminobutyrate aminotransferase